MRPQRAMLRTAAVGWLAVLLFLQLTGLACLPDLWSVGNVAPSRSVAVSIEDPASPPAAFPTTPFGASLHDCPCHYAATPAPHIDAEHDESPGVSVTSLPLSTTEGIPPVVFHPPLALV